MQKKKKKLSRIEQKENGNQLVYHFRGKHVQELLKFL